MSCLQAEHQQRLQETRQRHKHQQKRYASAQEALLAKTSSNIIMLWVCFMKALPRRGLTHPLVACTIMPTAMLAATLVDRTVLITMLHDSHGSSSGSSGSSSKVSSMVALLVRPVQTAEDLPVHWLCAAAFAGSCLCSLCVANLSTGAVCAYMQEY